MRMHSRQAMHPLQFPDAVRRAVADIVGAGDDVLECKAQRSIRPRGACSKAMGIGEAENSRCAEFRRQKGQPGRFPPGCERPEMSPAEQKSRATTPTKLERSGR